MRVAVSVVRFECSAFAGFAGFARRRNHSEQRRECCRRLTT